MTASDSSTPENRYFAGCQLVVHYPARTAEVERARAEEALMKELPGIELEWRRGSHWMPISAQVPAAHAVAGAEMERDGVRQSVGAQAIVGIALGALRAFER